MPTDAGTDIDVNQLVIDLWEKWASKLQKGDSDLLMPLLYPKAMKQGALLFVSLNPSFVPAEIRKHSGADTDLKYLRWQNGKDANIKKCLVLDTKMRQNYPKFFGIFEKIAKRVTGDESKWEHVDLFFNRKTSQKDFVKQILENPDLKTYRTKQLDLSEQLMCSVHPKAIVVANKRASDEFKKRFRPRWRPERGYHTVAFDDGKPIPVFLCSMLSGQRALDIYSRQRLEWHIKKALGRSGRKP